jgi:hypothetical protein
MTLPDEVSAEFFASVSSTVAGAVSNDSTVDRSRSRNINEPPWSTTESKTIKQQMENKGSVPGTAAKTGTRIKSSELSPRGPNQAIKRRLRKSSRVPAREIKKATGRINSTAIANRKTGQLSTVSPLQINELPNRTKVKRSVISAVVWPYSRKQSQSSTSSAAIVIPAAKAARKPLP